MPFKDKNKKTEYQHGYHSEWYAKNKEERKKQIQDRRNGIAAWFKEYKKSLSCLSCGFSHPAALDFHHRDASLKDREIGRLVNRGASEKRIMSEIAKCDVLCANCHRIVHFQELPFEHTLLQTNEDQHM